MEFFQKIKGLLVKSDISYFSIFPKELTNITLSYIDNKKDLVNLIKYLNNINLYYYTDNILLWKELFYLKFKTFNYKIMDRFYNNYQKNYSQLIEKDYYQLIEKSYNTLSYFERYTWLFNHNFYYFEILNNIIIKHLYQLLVSDIDDLIKEFVECEKFIQEKIVMDKRFNFNCLSFIINSKLKIGLVILTDLINRIKEIDIPEIYLMLFKIHIMYYHNYIYSHNAKGYIKTIYNSNGDDLFVLYQLSKEFTIDCFKLVICEDYTIPRSKITDYLKNYYKGSDKQLLIDLIKDGLSTTCTKILLKHLLKNEI